MSNQTERTPGPWHTAEYDGEKDRYVVGPNDELIADCYAPSFDDVGTPENYRANARFIAAAPELLAALIELANLDDDPNVRGLCDNLPSVRRAYKKARVLIAKLNTK